MSLDQLRVHALNVGPLDNALLAALPDAEFARWLTIEHGVTGIPLSPFYETPPAGQRLIRFCFAKKEETLNDAVARLKKIPVKG